MEEQDPITDYRKRGRKAGQRPRTRHEIIRDRRRIMDLKILFRLTNAEIVEKINKLYEDEPPESWDEKKGKFIRRPELSEKTIEAIITAANKDTDAEITEDLVAERKKAIKQYEAFAALCMRCHEASLQGKTVNITEEKNIDTDKAKGLTTLVRELTENKDGNTKYLDLYERAMWRIAELKAIIPPKKIAPTNPQGTESYVFEGAEESKRLAAIAAELGLKLSEQGGAE